MIEITRRIRLSESELKEEFIRASGPGGQNVNKVATAVRLSFDVAGSPSLAEEVRERLVRLAGRRLSKEGVLSIVAQRFRTQERNRLDARERLFDLIRRAAEPPVRRRATAVPRASRQERRDAKGRRAQVKARRARPSAEE
ncbi:MAG: aminoacyl-tRNA hydrolase [Alphaproteobacteria bacterium]|nr:aminoacyl-tRNA hydrolase [Alphaproteobacteria bacterium]